jgi:hypothetical protein
VIRKGFRVGVYGAAAAGAFATVAALALARERRHVIPQVRMDPSDAGRRRARGLPVARIADAGVVSLLLMVILSLSSVVLRPQREVFNSPDEFSNYIFTRTFAQTGKLWYSNDLLDEDKENLLHPRGAITTNGRAVPFNYLGLPISYAPIYKAFGENTKYVALVLAVLTITFLCRTAAELFGASLRDALVAIVGCTPLVYHFNLPYMNALPAITMFAGGCYFLARYVRRPGNSNLVGASVLFSLSMFFRYEYVVIASPLVALMIYAKIGRAVGVESARALAAYAGITVLCFIAPVLALNRIVYGSWLTYGYSLFNRVYFPQRSAQEGLSLAENALRTMRSVLLPSYPLDLAAAGENLVRCTIFLAPVFTVTAGIGACSLLKRGALRPAWLALFLVFLVYVLLYRGASGNVWSNTTGFEPTFNAAVVRYWLPIYVLLMLLCTYALTNIRAVAMKIGLSAAIVATGVVTLGYTTNGNVRSLREVVAHHQAWTDSHLSLIPNDAVVYAGRSDKRVATHRDTAAWWNGEESYDPEVVAQSMSRVAVTGRPIFIIVEREVDIPALNRALRPYGLQADEARRSELSRVRSMSEAAAVTPPAFGPE